MLILHGENDAARTTQPATGFQRALEEPGCSVEFVVYPREPHGVSERAHQLDILKRVRSWCDCWLR